MITASAWVPRGAAAEEPTKYEVDEDEFARISKLAKLKLEDAQQDLRTEQSRHQDDEQDGDSEMDIEPTTNDPRSTGENDDDLKAYDLEHYDTDSGDEDGEIINNFANARSLAYHDSNADDPYITLNGDEDDAEDYEDLKLLPTDNMIVAAKVEDEVAHLEVYVYEDDQDNLYVHHDIMLPAIPLCVEWLDLPIGKGTDVQNKDRTGNYVAVGTFDPDIEIWDLDTVGAMYPDAILGQGEQDAPMGQDDGVKKKKKRKKTKKANDAYHVDAVLSLAANRHHRNLLASSSADKTIKLWDLNTATCAKSYSHHTDKVCSLAWNPTESTVLLSGSYDRTVIAADMRAPDTKAPKWSVTTDVEHVAWDPHNSHLFFITTEGGTLHCNDVRHAPSSPEGSQSVWTLQAHDTAISSFDVNPVIPGLLVTGSKDKTVKIWNVESNKPNLVVSRNLDVGRVFTTKFASDEAVAFRLAVGGSRGTMQIWDTSTNAAVRRVFANRMAAQPDGITAERIVGLGEDSSDSEEEGGPEPGGEAEDAGWESMDEDAGA